MRPSRTALLTTALLIGACGTSTGEAAPAAELVAAEEPTATTQTIPTLVGTAEPDDPAPTTTVPPSDPGPGGTTSSTAPTTTTTPTTTTPGTVPGSPTVSEPPSTEPEPGATPGTTAAPAPDPTSAPGGAPWSAHPLAAAVPDVGELGVGWQLEVVEVVEANRGGSGDEICGIDEPPTPGGLEVRFERDDLSVLQLLVASGPEASATLDAFRSAVECGFGDELPPGTVVRDLDVTPLGADDAVAVGIELGTPDESASISTSFVIARWGDLLVTASVGSFGGDRPMTDEELLSLTRAVHDRLAAAGALS